MLVSDLFTRLSYGKLSNLSISNEGSGSIVESKQPKLVHYTNEALLRLYSRFVLKENDLVLELAEHILFYRLESRYATSNPDPDPNDVLYIRDTEHKPFTDDVIKVLAAYDIYGREVPLNDHEHPRSIFTPQPLVVQVPRPVEMKPLSILYQAKHDPLSVDDLSAEVVIPHTLEEALLAYIAAQVFNDMGTAESLTRASQHMLTYETICAEVEDHDLVNTSRSITSAKFEKRGFV